MSVTEIPVLTTERLTLRAFRGSDWDAFAAMEAKPEVRRYRGGNVLTREQTWDSMQRLLGQWVLRGYGVFAIEHTQTAEFLGFAGILYPADWPEAELSYSLDPAHWGQGYAMEAAVCARDWAFTQFGFERLASFIMPENVRSIRLAQSIGAVREGTIALRGQLAEWWVHYPVGHGPRV